MERRFPLIAYLIPLAYCTMASVGTVVFGFGGFPNDGFVRTVADTMGLSGIPTWAVIVLFVLPQGTTGMVAGVGAAAGEEIGWRGFLAPELARVLPFTGVALLSSFIWAAWHRDRDQLRAGLAATADRQSVAADLPARQRARVNQIGGR